MPLLLPLQIALLLLLAGLFVTPGSLRRASDRVQSYLPTLEEIDVPEPPPDDAAAIDVSILRLKNAKYRPGKPLEQWVSDLDGEKIRLSGYMAIGTLEGLSKFELVPESCECGRSKVNHFVEVTLTDGVTKFRPGIMTIVGTFHAGEVEEDGFVTSVYRLTAKRLPQ